MVTESMIHSKGEVTICSAKLSHSIMQRLVLRSVSMSFIPCPLGHSSYFMDYISRNPVGWWESRDGNQIQPTSDS